MFVNYVVKSFMTLLFLINSVILSGSRMYSAEHSYEALLSGNMGLGTCEINGDL